jgi:hypothetical protein
VRTALKPARQQLCARAMGCCTRARAELAFDVLTAAVSLADIVTDVFVAREFHLEGHSGFFACSVALLLVAQLSYAFMFAGTFAPTHSPAGQLCVFTLALPVGQLVPIFAWVESLRLPWLTRSVRRLGLTPSSDAETAGETASDADELWAAIQSKYRSHAGFLLEAIVEAVPQGLLQTVFVVVHGQLTPLNALSLSFSLVVLCSKGWIFSYSLHRTTFIFNSLCIAADIVGLFATVCWLATPATVSEWWPSQLPEAYYAPDAGFEATAGGGVPAGCVTWYDGCNTCVVAQEDSSLLGCTKTFCEEPAAPYCLQYHAGVKANATHASESVIVVVDDPDWSLGGVWVALSSAGLLLSYTGGFGLLLFAVFDDHLKLDIKQRLRGHSSAEDPPLVRLYLYRTVGWLLALLPCSVVWLTARLSFLPVLVFHSFDPEHATRPTFYRRLYSFLHTGLLPPPADGGVQREGEAALQEPSLRDEDVSAEAVTARLVAGNEWIAHARAAKPELLRRLAAERRDHAGSGGGWRPSGGRGRTAAMSESAVVAAWSRIVGAEHRGGQRSSQSRGNRAEDDEELDLESLLLILNQPVKKRHFCAIYL